MIFELVNLLENFKIAHFYEQDYGVVLCVYPNTFTVSPEYLNDYVIEFNIVDKIVEMRDNNNNILFRFIVDRHEFMQYVLNNINKSLEEKFVKLYNRVLSKHIS